jgi:hypothetical protein
VGAGGWLWTRIRCETRPFPSEEGWQLGEEIRRIILAGESQIFMARYFGGSFWRIYLAGHFGAFIWRVFTGNETNKLLSKRRKEKKEMYNQ